MAVKCPKCHSDNPETLKFCGECGTQLSSLKAIHPEVTETFQASIKELTTGSTFAGRYQIIEELGKGGMGKVYRVLDKKLNEEVALKLIKPEIASDKETIKRFNNELKLARKIGHRNVGKMYELMEDGGTHFITMEYVPGQDLKGLIRQSKQLAVGTAIAIAKQVCEGLAEAHRLGIIHRDLKPSNIIIDKDGNARIIDFGIARSIKTNGITGTGVVIGTPEYMSPEQVEGKEADQRSDIYSLGVILYQMVTGRVPFEGDTPLSVAVKQKTEAPRSPRTINPQVSEDLSRTILRCLEKEKEKRRQTAEEVLADLDKIEKGIPTAERIIPKKERVTSREITVKFSLRKLAVPVSIIIAVAAVAVIVFVFILAPSKRSLVPSAEAASVAALPSQVFGAAEFKYLTDAIPSTLSTYLGQIEGLEIKSPPTSFEVEKVHGDLRKIADAYGVKALVKTSVTAEKARFVLSVQLIEAKSLRQVWGKTYEGADYLDLLQKTAEGVRQAVKPASSRAPAVPEKPGGSPAELAFRRGQYYSNRYNNLHEPSDFEEAFTAFKKVLELDPKMADAAAEIAWLFEFKIESGVPPQEAVPEIESWARRALQINERCSKGWTAIAMMETLKPRGNMKKSFEFGLKAAFYGPEDAMAQLGLGNVFFISGPFSLSLSTYIESGRLDPLYTYSFLAAALTLLFSGRNEEALSYIGKSLSIEPEVTYGLFVKAQYLIYLGRLKESAELLKKLEKAVIENKLPRSEFVLLSQLQSLQTGEGKSAEKALAEILKIVESPEISYFDLNNYALDFPPILVRQGKKEPALRILEKGVGADAVAYDFLMLNPDLQKLKGEPKFERLLDRAKTQFKDKLKIIDEARTRGEFPRYLEKPLAELLDKLGLR